MINARHQRWMRQRTLPLVMVTVLCIIGLEGTTAGPGSGKGTEHTKDTGAGPLSEVLPTHRNASSPGETRQRRLIPYMQYYVTSTGAPPPSGADSAAEYQPSFNQVYNYRPINTGPLREPTDASRPSYYPPKHGKPQQQPVAYRPQEDSVSYEYQPARPAVQQHHRKHHYSTQPKLGPKTLVPAVSVSPFTYEYNHRHQPQSPLKVEGAPSSSPSQQQHHQPATSYAVLNGGGDHAGHPVELYERPKYAVIPREREPPYDAVPQRFAVLPAKLYGIEIHTKSQPHPEEDSAPPTTTGGGKFYLPNPVSGAESGSPSRKPTLYQSVPVYKKSRINPFLPSNTIPGPFTPMTSGSSSVAGPSGSSGSGGNAPPLQPHHESGGTRVEQEQQVVQLAYVTKTSPVTERPVVEYHQSYDHGAPIHDSRGHAEGYPSPYLLVKTVPKYYYEKQRVPAPVTPSTPVVPYQVYYKEKPSEPRKPHSNHSGYTRPRIPGVVPVRIAAEPVPHTAGETMHEHSRINAFYTVGQHLYKVPVEQQAAPPPPRQHLTETVLPQKMIVKEVAAKVVPSPPAGQYFLGANYKLYKVPAKQQYVQAPEQTYTPSYAHHPQVISMISSTTPKPPPVFYSSTPAPPTSVSPVYETPVYPAPMYSQPKPPRQNRTEYTDRQRFYPQSMRHPNQHKPRPIPLTPPLHVEREKDRHELGPVASSTSASLSDLLKSLQDSNLLPRTLTPDNIDNSIRTLVKILNNLKENGRHQQQHPDGDRRPPPSLVAHSQHARPNYTSVEPDTYAVDQDDDNTYPQHGGPPMLINKIVSPGPNTGKPGIDYPALAEIPETSFKCKDQRYKGFFGDPETNCQVWHYCDLNGGKASFLCPNGTIFSQVALTCDWWFNVKCSTTAQLYVLNERLYKYILPFTPKFPEDYSGPLVDKYLALKFQEMEEKMKQQRTKGAKQGSIAIPNAVPDNDEVNGNTLEDNDDRYNQNQPYPVKYVTTEAGSPERTSPESGPSSPGPVTLEDIDAELQRGAGSPGMTGEAPSGSSSTPGPSAENENDGPPTSPAAAYRTSSVPTPTTTTFIISTEDPPNDDYREMMPEAREHEEDEFTNVLNTEQPTGPSSPPSHPSAAALHRPTTAPVLGKVRRIEVKNDGTSGHLIRNPNYDRRRRK